MRTCILRSQEETRGDGKGKEGKESVEGKERNGDEREGDR